MYIDIKMYSRIALFLLVLCTNTFAQSISLQGQLSNWFVINNAEDTKYQVGIRYIPSVFLQKHISTTLDFDLECAVKSFLTFQDKTPQSDGVQKDITPYRLTARLSTSRFEARLGLQKMSFGAATIFRPLMWFDTIDPRDPLQITDGVYGLLLRYYFLNNTNLWLWGLYGNEDPKGWELIRTKEDTPEFGGRLQLPLYTGEIAFSYHYRKIDLGNLVMIPILQANKTAPEHRFALDGKWDFGVGCWIEGYIQHQKSDMLPYNWGTSFNVGLDYTFNLGNGLNILGEYFIFEKSDAAFSRGERSMLSALSLNYPLGIIDALNAIIYYDVESKELYRFISWQRTYDRWRFYLFGFWNPQTYQIYQNVAETTQYTGLGFQLMVVFNH